MISCQEKAIIIIPSYNDWQALEKLILLIDQINIPKQISLEIVIVDDYSNVYIPDSLINQQLEQIQQVNILRLLCNLGHQRAIAVGLCYIHTHLNCNLVIVMDGDGEDNPFEIERLINIFAQQGENKIVFAKRSKRSETKTFKFFYLVYKNLYKLLVGKEISVGNFSLIPGKILKNVVIISGIWNHYASAIHRSRIPYVEVDVPRAKRLAGKPKMNLVSLVTHGLSSIAVYGDIVGTRILILSSMALLIISILSIAVLMIKFLTTWAIPGWTTYTVGFLFFSFLQIIVINMIFSMIILASRNNSNVIPIRDYQYYVDNCFSLSSLKSLIHE